MSACGADQKNTAQTSSSTKESAEVSSGASKQAYTDPKEMKESYDIVIVELAVQGWQPLSKQKMLV